MKLRKSLLVVMLLFGLVPAAQAQLPVIDAAAIAKLVQEIGILTRQLNVLLDQYRDMLKQGMPGSPQFQTHTARLLALMAELGQKQSILYGKDASQTVWPELMTEDAVDTEGTWLEAERERSHATMTTQQDLLRQLEERKNAWVDDEAHLDALQEELKSSTGRNAIQHAQGALMAEQIRQTHALQALVMALANSQIVAAASVENEKANREANERAFLRNFDREPQTVEFTDVGLTDWDVPVYQRGAQ